VKFLEGLQIMPKTMPGLQKVKGALEKTDWFRAIDPAKIIVVAGTNGKGSTCAALEALLLDAGQWTGFYSSPHLVSTTERIRVNGENIPEAAFLNVFNECLELIKSCELSHFEALTLMAGHYFFNREAGDALDFVILEVGLGGTFDATNAFPHKYNIITSLGIDHTSILGKTLPEIAGNKFGVVGKKSIVVHQRLSEEVADLKAAVKKSTNSNWIESETASLRVDKSDREPRYFLNYLNEEAEIALSGARAVENIMNAVTMFQVLGFDFRLHKQALKKISWKGRMQRLVWPELKCPLYLSGDHNEPGILSLLEILKDYTWNDLHVVVGIGTDKDSGRMLELLQGLPRVKLYLTETPFKGLKISDYPESFLNSAEGANPQIAELLKEISKTAAVDDLCVVTGSLYLVGKVLASVPVE
jgi:dihydrofolate synthase/folylpolyglutamate synthase